MGDWSFDRAQERYDNELPEDRWVEDVEDDRDPDAERDDEREDER